MKIVEKRPCNFLMPLFRLGHALEKSVQNLLKIDCYEVEAETLVRYNGRFRRKESLPLKEIKSWRIVHEMTFDIIEIVSVDGSIVRWIDRYDSLRQLLRQKLPSKEMDGEG